MNMSDKLNGFVADTDTNNLTKPIFNPYLFWEEDYTSLENEFTNFLKYIPLSKEHEDVWSLKLANLLLLIGSSIDSFFKCTISSLRTTLIYNHIESHKYHWICSLESKERECVTYQGIGYTIEDFKEESNFYKNLLKADKKHNMGLYREIFNEYYKLSDKVVYVLRTREEIKPFDEWEEDKSPDWWLIYRDLKHSRFEHRKSATLKIVLKALAGLFLLNTCNPITKEYIYNIGIIRSNMHLIDAFFKSATPDTMGQPIIAKTNMFGYVWDVNSHYGQYPWTILDPGNVYGL